MDLAQFELQDQGAIVTGAGRGLGKAISLGLAEAGANLVVVSRTPEELEITATEVRQRGRQAFPLRVNVTRQEDVEQMVQRTLEEFGHIDILVNNAGIALPKPALELSLKEWEQVITTNLTGVFLCCQVVGREMVRRGYGKIINIASLLGLHGMPRAAAYAASKGGVIQLTKVLALEWVEYNVRVNAICPGYFDTPMNQHVLADPQKRAFVLERTPMRRLGQPKELVGTVVFLASAASDFLTGQVICVDGGWTAW